MPRTPWGLTRFSIAQDLLTTGRVALSTAAGLFEDGTPFAVPGRGGVATAAGSVLRPPATCCCILRRGYASPAAAEIGEAADEGCYQLRSFEAYDTHSGAPAAGGPAGRAIAAALPAGDR
ncbi:MAG: type VI secretion system baseplate subunit TssK [Acetobacteraceae bacterium]